MPGKASKKPSRRRATKQKKTESLKALMVVYLAVIFLPWQNIINSDALLSATYAATMRPESAKVAAVVPVGIGAPVRLMIPSIRVNAVIERAGIKKDGSMDTPKLPKNTAWYMFGPKPGETGSAVIAGHVNWWNGASSAFANLGKVKIGDKITVQDDKGAKINFVASKIKKFDAAAEASDVFISNDGKAHLNLVTCVGVWNKKTKQYSQRLVIFADKTTP